MDFGLCSTLDGNKEKIANVFFFVLYLYSRLRFFLTMRANDESQKFDSFDVQIIYIVKELAINFFVINDHFGDYFCLFWK